MDGKQLNSQDAPAEQGIHKNNFIAWKEKKDPLIKSFSHFWFNLLLSRCHYSFNGNPILVFSQVLTRKKTLLKQITDRKKYL